MSNYYDYYKNERKIPGIIAIVIIGVILAIPLFFLKQRTQPTTSLGASNDHSISVTTLNLTTTSVDLFWKTNDKSVDTVQVWSKAGTSTLVTDIHDIDSKKTARNLHFFSLRNLTANTEYYIAIQHNDKILGNSENPYFSFTTQSSSAITTSLPPVYGKLVDDTGKPQSETLLITKIKDAAVLGGFTKSDGSFLVSLCCLRNKTTQEPLNPSRDEVISIKFENEAGDKAHISAPLSKTSPFQESIVLGSDVKVTNDALEDKSVLGEATSSTSEKKVDGTALAIYYPKDSAVIPGRRPLVKGTSPAGSTVKISFPVEKRSFQVKTNSNGDFELSTPFNLTGGAQTVIAQTTDEKGKLISVSRAFTIPKSGEAVLGEATPSGTITTLTPTPSIELTQALTPTVEPTDIVPSITPSPTLLPSGIDFGLFSMMSVVLILFGVGIILIF